MSWDQQQGVGGNGGQGDPGGHGSQNSPYGTGGGFVIPPPPLFAPQVPPGPADPLRALAVALLNLSGLGLGYALLRRWFSMAACWVATGVLLFVALPADPDGVSVGAVVAYLTFLALTAAHGAYRGLRSPLLWPPKAPLAVLLGLVLLAAPVGGVVAYDNARDEATQKMLLDRLDHADRLVLAARERPFADAETDYRTALTAYHDLHEQHPGSRAAKKLPDRLNTYYKTIAAPYDRKDFCGAIAPLTYLRNTVPTTYGANGLGALASFPDDRLATSLYECGAAGLGQSTGTDATDKDLKELLTAFPASAQAAKVEPAVRSTIDTAAKGLTGDDPCTATDRLITLGKRVTDLPGDAAGITDALEADSEKTDGYVESGSYACGVHQYTHGDFSTALASMNTFVTTYPHDRNLELAKRIAIAAEKEPAAGKQLPTLASGGDIPVKVVNDSPDAVEILYTGKVTGRFTLPACDACSTYPSKAVAHSKACRASGVHYPQKSLNLPAGTVYFLHKSGADAPDSTPATSTSTLEPGYIYTECADIVETGSGTTL